MSKAALPLYDDGYKNCPCFWGNEPGSLVKLFCVRNNVHSWKVLDAGCGEGKNARYLSQRGAKVLGMDISDYAIRNAKTDVSPDSLEFAKADIRAWDFPENHYDLIVAYGLFHCFESEHELQEVMTRLKLATKRGGWHIVCAFNDGPHDLSAHPGFQPLLLSHDRYLSGYSDWKVQSESSSVLHESHPHNNILHFHSLTRLIARNVS